jgi:hypothetical protein
MLVGDDDKPIVIYVEQGMDSRRSLGWKELMGLGRDDVPLH